MKKYIILVAITLIVFAGPASGQITVKKSFTGVKRIKLATSSGDCELLKSPGTTVELTLTHSYDERSFSPRIEQSGERLELGEEFNGRNFNGNVRWKLSIPDGVKITFSTGSGNLMVSGVSVDLSATSGSGDLEFSSVKGEIDANTGSGNVDITNFNGEAKFNTGSGDMSLTDSEGEVDLNCGSGDIKVYQAKGYFAVNTGSGNINADKITINASSKFNTGSGRAKVTLAATPKFDLSVNSGSGDAELNFNGNDIVGEVVMKASKRHGRISAPFEFDKTEEIDQYDKDNITVVKTAQRGKGTNRISVSTGSGDAVLRQ
ncbi:MAG TPA: DUF4097 family beta strand repeat-containing protein [Cyclobacteriaceae bacterium]|nr:DUF4097 family beta strand repeat-containing protein [Cyclobacteriaceae bacterium]